MSKYDIFMFIPSTKVGQDDKTPRRDNSINMKLSKFQLFTLEINYSTKVHGYTHQNSNASFRLPVFIIIIVVRMLYSYRNVDIPVVNILTTVKQVRFWCKPTLEKNRRSNQAWTIQRHNTMRERERSTIIHLER